ncbi:MAG TPA: NUDIX hydrolase [bacterium]|nr:NUDIX hydrolase [bacterium]
MENNLSQKIQRTTTKALIIENGKAFMLKDERGNWELPGGRIDWGETPEETIKRELAEELQVSTVEVGKIIDVFSFCNEATGFHFIALVYQCKADLSRLTLSDEHQKYGWFSLAESEKLPMREGYRKVLRDTLLKNG